MNATNTTPMFESTFTKCGSTNPLLWNEDYLVERSLILLLAIALSMASCPFTILMNALVIIAVKTRPGLQTMHNILLACLAGTDLLVGVVVQPSFIVAEIFVLNGLSPADYCRYFTVALRFSSFLFQHRCSIWL